MTRSVKFCKAMDINTPHLILSNGYRLTRDNADIFARHKKKRGLVGPRRIPAIGGEWRNCVRGGKEEDPGPQTQKIIAYRTAQGKLFLRRTILGAMHYNKAVQVSERSHSEGSNGLKATVKWVDGVSFVVETGSGHALVVDGAPEAGGRNVGPRPMELVLAGTAACTAFDVIWILKKARQPVTDCVVDAEAERAPEEPKVFTKIHLRYRVSGNGLNPAQVERAVKLSKEKYCSATLMLAKTAEITFEISIEDCGARPAS
jgi:putative redox protein